MNIINNKNKKVLAIVAHWFGANDASFAYGFKENGCELLIIDIQKWFANQKLSERLHRKVFKSPYNFLIEEFNLYICKTAKEYKPDITFVAKGLWVRLSTIYSIKKLNSIIVHWHPDDAYNPENSSDILDECIPHYDIIVTPKSFNVKEYEESGAKKVIYLPYAYDPKVHYPVKISNKEKGIYGSDVSFVGAKRKKRVNQLSYIYRNKLNLKIWGTGWRRLPLLSPLRKACTFKGAYAEEMSKVFTSSKIALGFLNEENRDLHTARTYEIPACGGFFLAERSNEHCEILREGIEADYFCDNEELVEKAIFYIKNESIRLKIANAGYEKILSTKSTYRDRVEKLLKIIYGNRWQK